MSVQGAEYDDSESFFGHRDTNIGLLVQVFLCSIIDQTSVIHSYVGYSKVDP